MLFIVSASALTVAAALITASRVVGFKRLVKHGTLVDVAFTVGMGAAFAGTLTGLLVAIVSGLFMAMFMSIAARILNFMPKRTCTNDELQGDEWVYNTGVYVR